MFEDITALEAKTALTRREFVVTTLATGFALAAQPVSAQTITTDTTGLVAGEVKIPVSGGEIPAYRAMPEAGRSFPVVRTAGCDSGLRLPQILPLGGIPCAPSSPPT